MLFRTRISRALLMGMLSLEVWWKVMRILMKSRLDGSIYLGFALKWRFEKKAWISGDLGRLKAFCVRRNQ